MPAPAERAFVATPFAGPGARVIASPFQFLADADTFLRVTSVCSVSGVTLAIQGRRYDPEGTLRPIVETHAPLSTRTSKTQDYRLGEGAMLNLTVFASAGTPLVGQCYVIVQLLRNFGSTAIVLGTLLGGYVTATQPLGFPGSPIQSSLEGEGALRFVTGTNPAANAEISETVPTNARWQVLGFAATFVASAAAGTRTIGLTLDDGAGNIYASSVHAISNGPSTTNRFTWMPGMPIAVNINSNFNTPEAGFPVPCYMLAGHRLRTSTAAIAAGDDWGAPSYFVREWLEL